MSAISGTIPYQIARAAQQAGYDHPADVAWYLVKKPNWVQRLFQRPSSCQACRWREKMEMEKVTFTWSTGQETHLLMFQCPRCKTIFYQEKK